MTDDLIKGAQEFKHHYYESDNDLMASLVRTGQHPKYFIISCIDSRSNLGTIFRAPPGTFFSYKAMGAIVHPHQKGTGLGAALQFAINYSKIETIIVLGHTRCGAIKALAEDIDDPEISNFINVAKQVLAKAQAYCQGSDKLLDRAEQEAILESAENLKSYPCVAKALSEKTLSIKSWQFDIRIGDLLEYNPSTNNFEVVTLDTALDTETGGSRRNA